VGSDVNCLSNSTSQDSSRVESLEFYFRYGLASKILEVNRNCTSPHNYIFRYWILTIIILHTSLHRNSFRSIHGGWPRGGAIVGGALISFTGICGAYLLFVGTAILGLVIYNVLQCLANKNDGEDQPEVGHQPVSSEDPGE